MDNSTSVDHASLLRSSGISLGFAESCGVRSVTDASGLPDGCPPYWSGLLPALLFPWTAQDGRVEWQIRPDQVGLDQPKYLFRSRENGYRPTPWVHRVGDASHPILYVEGTRQSLSVAEHAPAGYGVVGLAGCWGGQDRGMASSVLSLARGRKAIVVMDADVRRNSQVFESGRLLREHLRREGATAVVRLDVLGPENVGIDDILGDRADPEEHLARLIELADDYRYPSKDRPKSRTGGPRSAGMVPPPTDPVPCARAFIAVASDSEGRPLHRYWREQWAQYDVSRGHWVTSEERDSMTAMLYQAFSTAVYLDDGQPVPWNPNRASIADVEAALRADAACRVPDGTAAPCWVGVVGSDRNRPPAGEFLAFPNTLLHLPTRKTVPPTPELFTMTGIPFDYDPTVTLEGTRWAKFLGEVFPDDAESVCRLQEVMGYLISGRTDLEKLFMLVGVPRAGKGTVGEVLRLLLDGSVTAASVDDLSGGDFALESLLNKSLTVIGDARAGTDPRRVSTFVERLLSISGGDSFRVNRKFRSPVVGPLRTNFLIMSNEELVLQEASGAAASRFEVIEFNVSFLDREDHGLKKSLAKELPAILNWALDGLERLDWQGGRFTESERSRQIQMDMRHSGAPHTRFADECLTFTTGFSVSADIYESWSVWALRNGEPVGRASDLSKRLGAAYRGQIRVGRESVDGVQVRVTYGVALSKPPKVGY